MQIVVKFLIRLLMVLTTSVVLFAAAVWLQRWALSSYPAHSFTTAIQIVWALAVFLLYWLFVHPVAVQGDHRWRRWRAQGHDRDA